ncbi:MAG TPA: hypothetical protein EYG21_02980 [Nitrospinaceae bacterium]|nr:hypothetical protein [Micavibrio sp.]HIL26346.1 hypothetical protein [Nitrospinaceae bacterium]
MEDNYIEWAESIFSSNRMKALLEKIDASDVSVLSSPHARTVFLSLLRALWYEYDGLIYDYKRNEHTSLSLLAWRTRNVLELNLWCRFCCEDKANAEIFFKEGSKDALNLVESLEAWGTKTDQPQDWFEDRKRSKEKVIEEASMHGHDDLDGKYIRISKAAEACGYGACFNLHYKFLSKFAHPTAFRLFIKDDKKEIARQAHSFLKQGALYFHDGFVKLERYIEESE